MGEKERAKTSKHSKFCSQHLEIDIKMLTEHKFKMSGNMSIHTKSAQLCTLFTATVEH